ncbi:MAG: hypothetical protein DRM97_00295, partial [Thermoprotei archaeon]
LEGYQLDNGLWYENVSYKFATDKGVALRLTLSILEGLLSLGVRNKSVMRAIEALLRLQKPEGYWSGLLRRHYIDYEVTARAIALLHDLMEDYRLRLGIEALRKWIFSSLSSGRCDQPWALPYVILCLVRLGHEEELKARIIDLIELVSRYQLATGDWCRGYRSFMSTFILMLALTDLLNAHEEVVRYIETLVERKRKLLRTIYDRNLLELLRHDIIREIEDAERLLPLNGVKNPKLLAAFSWAYKNSIPRKLMPKRETIELYKGYLQKYSFSSIQEHARTLAEYVVEEVAKHTDRYENLALTMRLYRLNSWNENPLALLRAALLSFPGVTSLCSDLYVLALYLMGLKGLESCSSQIQPPADSKLLIILRRLGMISTPIVVAMRNYSIIRKEVMELSKELFPRAPFLLYSLASIAKKWCLRRTRCVRVTREGLLKCPLFNICTKRRYQ